MRVSIDAAVFGLLPVPMPPDATGAIPERHRADHGRDETACTSLERARIRFSIRDLAHRLAARRRAAADRADSEPGR